MKNITFNLTNVHQHGSAFFDYLALRKQFFVDTLNWNIPHNADVEMDQYDNPTAHYSLVLDDDGRVIAGARAMPTTAKWGDYTYMLKDAMTGKLASIPDHLLKDVIDSPKVWETTRLVISPEIKSNRMRMHCLDMIAKGMITMANENGADTLIALSNLWLLRTLKHLGYGAELLGESYQNDEDGHVYAVMAIAARQRQLDSGLSNHKAAA